MKTLTLKEILSWGTEICYTEEEILFATNGRKSLTAAEIANLDNVLARDLLWLLLREYFFSLEDLMMLKASFAEDVLKNFEKVHLEDQRPRDAIKAARLFVIGEIGRDELGAAESAARSAAESAAAYDASVVSVISFPAAYDARTVVSVARSAAYAAATFAAESAAYSAAHSVSGTAASGVGYVLSSTAWSAARSASATLCNKFFIEQRQLEIVKLYLTD